MQLSDIRKGQIVFNDKIVESHGTVRATPISTGNNKWAITWSFGDRKVLITERSEVGSLRALYEFWKSLTVAQRLHIERLESEASNEIERLKAFEDSYDPSAEDEQVARLAAMG